LVVNFFLNSVKIMPMKAGLLLLPTMGLLLAVSSVGAAIKIITTVPADGARDVCPDTLLRLTFDNPPTLGANGTITISSTDGAVVDSVDLGASVRGAQPRIIGGATFTNYPVIISSNGATIFPHLGVLRFGQEYRVSFSPEVFGGATNARTWSFRTKAARPAPGATNVTVAADGSGDFCTVQGAVDWVPIGNTTPRQFFIKNGIYEEIVYVTNKAHLAFAGEDRAKTVIEYANNENFNYRGLKRNLYRQTIGIDADDFSLRNLTVRNATRKGGSQAEALRIDGLRCRVEDVDFYSFQDALKLSGEVFVNHCYIEGDVDFIWGFGACFFTNCEIKCLTSRACITQIRNDRAHFGDVFVDCRLTKSPGVTDAILSRIEVSRFPDSQVAWINCQMDDHISPRAWQFTAGTNSPDALRFWEYHTTDLAGTNLANVSQRLPISKQLTAEEAAPLRNAHHVFGDWMPTP
jgi:pectin methylesterase-like acyl-CoA thioesterase